MTTLERLRAISNYFEKNRQVGHTQAVMQGAKSGEKCIIISSSAAQGTMLKKDNLNFDCYKGVKVISLYQLDKLKDETVPLVMDNLALQTLLADAAEEIERLNFYVDENDGCCHFGDKD